MTEYTAPWKLKAAVGIESVYGDAVVVTDLIPLLAHDISYSQDSSVPLYADSHGFETEEIRLEKSVSGSFGTYYDYNNSDLLFRALLGGENAGTTSTYWYPLLLPAQPPSLTYVISGFRNKVSDRMPLLEYPGLVITGATLTGVAGQPVKIVWDVTAMSEHDTLTTPYQPPVNTQLSFGQDRAPDFQYPRNTALFREAKNGITCAVVGGMSLVFPSISSWTIKIENIYESKSYGADTDEFVIQQPIKIGHTVTLEFVVPGYNDEPIFDAVYEYYRVQDKVAVSCGMYNGNESSICGGFWANHSKFLRPEIIGDIDMKVKLACFADNPYVDKWDSPMLIATKGGSK